MAWLLRGKALSALNRQNEALTALNRALKLGQDSSALYEAIGEVYINGGKVDLAIHYFQEALRRDPDRASSHYYLGLAYGKKGMRVEAKKEIEKGIFLKNNPPQNVIHPHNF